MENKIRFINLKEHLTDFFEKHDFTFFCEDVNKITENGKFNKSVHLNDASLEENLRFEDSCYPEYLFFISNVDTPTVLANRVNDILNEIKNVPYNPYLFQLKMYQFFEIILYKDFPTGKWWDNWIMDRCYVIKVHG
ncbi:hypothetical protein CAP35_04845 [Chitinophagaceae bacterium IBVUCB1]|nr:hypothetical protein CAP35_04845 [Chitinophagaceae bacterium IBVUCB1]